MRVERRDVTRDSVVNCAPMRPTRLQLGTSRLELLPDACLRVFLDKSWIHLGEPPRSYSLLHRAVWKLQQVRRGILSVDQLYTKTNFKPFCFKPGYRLEFEDDSFGFIYSEHFFEHLHFDEAIELFRECRRVLTSSGILRVVVPDADLRTYEPPEPVGFPSLRMPLSHPDKHKTRWSVYSLTEALKASGLEAKPLSYSDRKGTFCKRKPAYDGTTDPLANDVSFIRRPTSLIVDGFKT